MRLKESVQEVSVRVTVRMLINVVFELLGEAGLAAVLRATAHGLAVGSGEYGSADMAEFSRLVGDLADKAEEREE